jgi:hypothetical protein
VTRLRKRMLEELQRRDYSHSTARIYLHIVSDFAQYFRRSPDRLGPEHIRQYQLRLFQKKLSPYTIRQHTAALRFSFFKTLHRNFRADYFRSPSSANDSRPFSARVSDRDENQSAGSGFIRRQPFHKGVGTGGLSCRHLISDLVAQRRLGAHLNQPLREWIVGGQ